jgi:hypothetical protein
MTIGTALGRHYDHGHIDNSNTEWPAPMTSVLAVDKGLQARDCSHVTRARELNKSWRSVHCGRHKGSKFHACGCFYAMLEL